jgi:hypothetical protein
MTKTLEEVRNAILNEPSHYNAVIDSRMPDLGKVVGTTTVIEMLPKWWLLKLFEEAE